MSARLRTHADVLVVTDRCGDHSRLSRMFEDSSWAARCVRSVAAAREAIYREPAMGAILCDSQLPDGTWRDVLAAAGIGPDAPPVIVMSRNVNEALWKEVLEGGGYDVVSMPCESRDLFRAVSLAWHQGQRRVGAVAGS